MKKLISLVLAIILIASTLVCAMPLAISAAEAPIEATPIVGWTHTGASGITRSEVTPLSSVMANGLALSAATPYDKGDGLAASGGHAIMDFTNNPYSLADTEGFLMYVKTDSANQLAFSVTASGFGYGAAYVVEGRSFYTLSKGADAWETKTITAGGTNKFVAALKFEEAFEGYVKIPYASLGSDRSAAYYVFDNTYTATQFCFRFRALGGDFGGAVVGPVSTYKTDSSSTVIKYPDEFIPSPIEATPIVGWTHNSASGITRSEVTPLSSVMANGLALSAATPYDKGDGLAASGGHTIMDFTNNPYSLADTEGFLMYVKTDSANQLAFSVTAAGFGYGAAYVVEGRSFYTLSKGADAWETKTITAGGTNKFVAALKFEEAFEGYVKIPYASLGSDRSAAYYVFDNTYTATQFCFRFRALGGDFGGAIVGPVSTYKTDSISTKIVYPDEFKPQPIKAIPLTGFKKGTFWSEVATHDLFAPEATQEIAVADGIKMTSETGAQQEFETFTSGKILASASYDENTYTMPADFATNGSFIIYVKVDGANKMYFAARTDCHAGWYTTACLKAGAAYEYAAIGDEAWTTATADENGIIDFTQAFEGYIKISVTALKSVDNVGRAFRYLSQVALYFKGIGGNYGDIIAGPFFVTTEDSASTVITVDEQYAPQPLNIKSFDFRDVRASGYNFSAIKIEETNNYKLYIDENTLSDTPVKHEASVKKWSYVENADGAVATGGSTPLVMTPNVNTYMKDAVGIVYYVKFDKPNAFSPALTFDNNGGRTLTLKPGQKVQVLANDSDEWVEKTIEVGNGTYQEIYGMVSFDSAFEGYIKVPFASCNNDGGFKPKFTGDNMSALTGLALRFKGIGDDTMYGSEVVAGVTGYFTEDTSKAVIGSISAPEYAYGDVNYDWKLDSADLVAVRKDLLGYEGYAGYKISSIVELVRLKKFYVDKIA